MGGGFAVFRLTWEKKRTSSISTMHTTIPTSIFQMPIRKNCWVIPATLTLPSWRRSSVSVDSSAFSFMVKSLLMVVLIDDSGPVSQTFEKFSDEIAFDHA